MLPSFLFQGQKTIAFAVVVPEGFTLMLPLLSVWNSCCHLFFPMPGIAGHNICYSLANHLNDHSLPHRVPLNGCRSVDALSRILFSCHSQIDLVKSFQQKSRRGVDWNELPVNGKIHQIGFLSTFQTPCGNFSDNYP